MGTLCYGHNLDTNGSRVRFVTGASHESRSRREKAQTSPFGKSQSLVTSTPTEEGISLVRIIGGPTTPNEAATFAEEDKYLFR